MKNIFWIIAAAFAFVACSDDDGPREKPFDGEVVSFEASEHLLDAMTGNDVNKTHTFICICFLIDTAYMSV